MMRPLFAVALLATAAALAPAQQPPAITQAAANPFKLTPVEQQFVDQVLQQWEQSSAQIKTFRCPFTRFTYNQFSPHPRIHFSEEQGEVSYQKPDKGSFKITEVKQWKAQPVAPGTPQPTGQSPKGSHAKVDPERDGVVGEHWVSDGKQIYEYRKHERVLKVSPIPPEMQGERIVDGPFPFLFGARKDDLKERFWFRVHPNPDDSVIHLVAQPRTARDAVNYKMVELMLDRKTLLPRAMQVYEHNQARFVFSFHLDKVSVNHRIGPVWQALFQSPRTPLGWRRVVDTPQVQQAATPGLVR